MPRAISIVWQQRGVGYPRHEYRRGWIE
jgi:hypothetical protein